LLLFEKLGGSAANSPFNLVFSNIHSWNQGASPETPFRKIEYFISSSPFPPLAQEALKEPLARWKISQNLRRLGYRSSQNDNFDFIVSTEGFPNFVWGAPGFIDFSVISLG
jgi:hypothetical protein